MKKIIILSFAAVVVVATVLAIVLNGGSSKPSSGSCEKAMRQQFSQGMADPSAAPVGTKPPQCKGISDQELNRIATKILGEYFK